MRHVCWIFIFTYLLVGTALADTNTLAQIKKQLLIEKDSLWQSAFDMAEDPQYPKTKLVALSSGEFSFEDKVLENIDEPIRLLHSESQLAEMAHEQKGERTPASVGADIEAESRLETVAQKKSVVAPAPRPAIFVRSIKSSSKKGSQAQTTKSESSTKSSTSSIGEIAPAPVLVDVLKPVDSAETFEDDSLSGGSSSSSSETSPTSTAEKQAPTAQDDYLTTDKNQTIEINISSDLLANDSDPDGQTITVVSFDNVSILNGAVVDNGNGTFSYSPPADATGTDRFDYTISNGTLFATATVEIVISDPAVMPAFEEVQTGVAVDSLSVSTSMVISAATNQLYVAAISISDTANSVTDVQGMGLTWQQLKVQCSNKDMVSLELWYAIGAPLALEAVTADFNNVVSAAQISVSRYSNVNPSDPIELLGSANPLGVDANAICGNAATASKDISYSVNTSISDGLVMSAIVYSKENSFSSISSSVISDINSGSNPDATGLVVQNLEAAMAQSYVLDGTLGSSTQWSSIGILIKP